LVRVPHGKKPGKTHTIEKTAGEKRKMSGSLLCLDSLVTKALRKSITETTAALRGVTQTLKLIENQFEKFENEDK